jgi:beta-phosphoglucomutase-like phosphatase (HAD superfamily)
MSLRIGFDMDGVLADFSTAFHAVEARLFGDAPVMPPGQPEGEAHGGPDAGDRDQQGRATSKRQREAIWSEIASTPDFWTTLTPTSAGAVKRLHDLALRHRWEVFFITQRPATAGETVQRQTQRWLVEQGFDLPSVLVIPGSRGATIAALRLDYHADDSPQNCVDIVGASTTKTILICVDGDPMADRVRGLGIGTAPNIDACLDILERASEGQSNPTLLKRLAAKIGWR